MSKDELLKDLINQHIIFKTKANKYKFCPSRTSNGNIGELADRFLSVKYFTYCVNHGLEFTLKCKCGKFC